MNPIIRSASALVPALLVLFALPSAAEAQYAPANAPTMPAAPTGPTATPSFPGGAPNPYDPSSPYYVAPAKPPVDEAQPRTVPVAAGVVPQDADPDHVLSDEPPNRTGLEVGLRTGLGFPMSSVVSGTTLSTFVSTEFPIWLSVGYRATEHVYFGVYGQYGFLGTTNCGAPESCSASDLRAGIDIQYHPQPREDLDPWIGYGAGYERLTLGVTGDTNVTLHLGGFELANLQAGLDWRVARTVTIGPFGSFSVGEYTTESNGTESVSVAQTTMHEWLMLGLRARVM